MRFIRRLGASLALVLTIVGVGVLWSHSGLASVVTDGHDGLRRPGTLTSGNQRPGADDRDGRRGAYGGTVVDRTADLAQTTATEAAVIGGVVLLDKKRRQHSSRLSLGR